MYLNSSLLVYATRFANVSWNHADWTLTTTNLDQGHYQSRMSIANGYHGINVAALGPFFETDTSVAGDDINGWPLFQRRQTFATIGGFFDSQPTTNGTNFPWLEQYGGDSVISGIPHWGGIVIDAGGNSFLDASTDSSMISNFSSTLNMKQGLMDWALTWSPTSNVSLDIKYRMFAHKLQINLGVVEMEITSRAETNLTIVNVLNGDCAVRSAAVEKGRTDNLIYTAVHPDGISNVTGYIYAGLTVSGTTGNSLAALISDRPYIGNNRSSIAEAVNVTLQARQPATFVKYVGIASTDGYADPNSTARNAALDAIRQGYDPLMETHIREWATIFPSESVDDFSFPGNGSLPEDPFIIESAITAVTNPYYLLQNTIGANALRAANNASVNSHSISVGGLASDSYAGLVFWDAEVWMQPGLVAAFPQAAQGIANYRVARYGQALANAQTAYQSSKNNTHFSSTAAVFSWTSGRFGNCTATGPCFDYEYHINGDIAQEFVNYWIASGDTNFFRSELFPIYDSLATFFSEVLTKNGSKYELTNMTDPDEYANMVDNGGFTMPLIADTLNNANSFRSMFGSQPNDTWANIAQNVLISRDENVGITLEYTGMNGSIDVKQADVVLDTFPLRYESNNYTQQASLNDLDYYAAKQSLAGPGMTYAIFSIVANEVSPSGCSSYTYQQYSENPYARAPWFQLSEQLVDNYQDNGGTHPAYPFLTGHGGANQVVLFGYLGLRLVPDWHLHIDPSLPPQIPQVRYRTFYWQGWPISAFSNYTHTTVTRLNTPIETANQTYANTAIPVFVGPGGAGTSESSYSMPPNGSITVLNRQLGSRKTVQGNIAQCQPVSSLEPYEPGQFPLAAIDGAASTKWQPSFANRSASITVALPVGQRVTAFFFDWAQSPPANFTVTFHNSSSDGASATTVAALNNVTVAVPYDISTQAQIVPYRSNTTLLNLTQPVYSAAYATLSVVGNQATNDFLNGTGASVAEWAILGDGAGAGGYGQDLTKAVFAKRSDIQSARFRKYLSTAAGGERR